MSLRGGALALPAEAISMIRGLLRQEQERLAAT